MIFLTIGVQLPFDRLVQEVDAVACKLDELVFGQIGDTCYRPGNFETAGFLSPSEFAMRLGGARAIVSHAGIGTILSQPCRRASRFLSCPDGST